MNIKYYYFINEFNKKEIEKLSTQISIIYRNYSKKNDPKELRKLVIHCKNNRRKVYISNNLKDAIKYNFDGLYIPSFHKKLSFQNITKRNFEIIGSAHNLKQIRLKEFQKVRFIFLSSIFKHNKNFLGIYKFKILSRYTEKKIIALGGISKFNEKKIKLSPIKSNTSMKKFISNVKKAKKYIKIGDIFQVVLSQRFQTKLTKKPLEIYKKLRKTNPSPFMYFFNFNDFQIIGASPEILVRLRNNKITIRPIAGTRPRGKNKKEDNFFKKDLLQDKKELSEHLMLLDLGRNDTGKVSKINTVKVTESFNVEKYSHVMHIVSNVQGEFNNKFSKFDTLLSGFPAGTVSGAPKIRAMEIIDELENTKRKVYAGGIGYFAANGDFDTCIALRTALTKNKKFYVQSGAGIVADSKPLNEFKETVNKAKALLKALE